MYGNFNKGSSAYNSRPASSAGYTHSKIGITNVTRFESRKNKSLLAKRLGQMKETSILNQSLVQWDKETSSMILNGLDTQLNSGDILGNTVKIETIG